MGSGRVRGRRTLGTGFTAAHSIPARQPPSPRSKVPPPCGADRRMPGPRFILRSVANDSRGGLIEVTVEIPSGSRNKYEFDHARHRFVLDRILYSSVHYPCDYGFIDGSLADDGDPLDVLVVISEPTFPGCVVRARPIGVLDMTDDRATTTRSWRSRTTTHAGMKRAPWKTSLRTGCARSRTSSRSTRSSRGARRRSPAGSGPRRLSRSSTRRWLPAVGATPGWSRASGARLRSGAPPRLSGGAGRGPRTAAAFRLAGRSAPHGRSHHRPRAAISPSRDAWRRGRRC